MSLFTKKTKIEDPLAGEKKRAAGFLEQLMQRQVDLPTQQIAGLTPTQQLVQRGLRQQIGDMGQSFDTSKQYYQDVLAGGYDPSTSPYYRGLRQEAERLKGEGITGVRQGAQLGGMLQSTPRMATEAATAQRYDEATLRQLGMLTEAERGRMGQAAAALPALEQQRTATAAGISQLADQERAIEQARNDAIYNQALQTIMFPYQQQARLASMIFGGSEPIITGGGLTDLGFITQAAAGAMS